MNAHSSIAAGIGDLAEGRNVDGMVPVAGYDPVGKPIDQVLVIEKAAAYGADAVFFEARADGRTGAPQALIYYRDDLSDDAFAALHRRLWSWGGAPLVYRRTRGLIQLFRLNHDADFIDEGRLVCRPVRDLSIAAAVASADAWWNAERLRNGTLWDDASAQRLLLSKSRSAHRTLFNEIAGLHDEIRKSQVLNSDLFQRLLILSLLIAYLAERSAIPSSVHPVAQAGATGIARAFADGAALIALLEALEDKFNGGVFELSDQDKATIKTSQSLVHFRRLLEAREDRSGQISLWERYSFKDLPVELISEIYQLFVRSNKSSVYTPPALVRLMLDEALDEPRIERMLANGESIFDPACGSGVFLVEGYKRLIAHWRSQNGWTTPSPKVLRELLSHVRGVDKEDGAVHLAAFSLCLAMCEALNPEDIAASRKLFPEMIGETLITSCFFEARQTGKIAGPIGVVVGNPPFESELKTKGAQESCLAYEEQHGPLPDKQVAYLFLHEAMEMLEPGGLLCMVQAYNLLYNAGAAPFRNVFFSRWDVREVLDFVSIRGLFEADTKTIAVVAEAADAPDDRRILHAVFRRTARARADVKFEVDHYDLNWVRRDDILGDDDATIWRSALMGGPRLRAVVERLRDYPTLAEFARANNVLFGEGFQQGKAKHGTFSAHINGRPFLPSVALRRQGIDEADIATFGDEPIQWPRIEALFTPPMLLIREHMDLQHAVWEGHYLTYKAQIVGFAGRDARVLRAVSEYLNRNLDALRGYVAANSAKLFTQKATSISCSDIYDLPLPSDGSLDLSENETIVLADVIDHYRDFVRTGFQSSAGETVDRDRDMGPFTEVLCRQIGAIYEKRPLRALTPHCWPGVMCQPFVFGEGEIDWTGADELRGKLDGLLREERRSLSMTRIARLYDGAFVFLLKPDRRRYWLRSVALRDADDLLVDLRAQGF